MTKNTFSGIGPVDMKFFYYFAIFALIIIFFIFAIFFGWKAFVGEAQVKLTKHGDVKYIGHIGLTGYKKLEQILNEASPNHPEKLVVKSSGGDPLAGILIGRLVRLHKLDVKVDRYCNSSCANYVFPAGKRKILKNNAIVVFHGGLRQWNAEEKIASAFRSLNENVKYTDKNAGKEATIYAQYEVKSGGVDDYKPYFPAYSSLCKYTKESDKTPGQAASQCYSALEEIELDFYSEITVDKDLPYVGQRGAFESRYKSYKYSGFTYDREALEKLGVTSVVMEQGWNAASNRFHPQTYQVQLKDL